MTKNKHGLTASEAERLLSLIPGSPGLPAALKDGSWYATGLLKPLDPNEPLDPNKQPERIPVHLWDILEIDFGDNIAWFDDKTAWDGGDYICLRFYEGEYERRLTAAPAPRTADLLAGKADGAIKAGRPTRKGDIEAAYLHLLGAKRINFDAPKTRLYEPIRETIRGDKSNSNLYGLGDEAIRKVISPLFDADKNKRSASP